MNKKWLILSSVVLLIIGITIVTNKILEPKQIKTEELINKKVLAIKIEQEDGSYTDATTIPTTGYVFNQEKSKCSNGATPSYDNNTKRFYADNLTQNGTSCYLTFDIKITTPSEDTIAKLNVQNIKDGTPDFSVIATGAETEDNNGVYVTDDPMYGTNAKTYYWRGAATTNHVIFDNKCWRIIRINGDGSVRLIYNGTPSENTCSGNGNSSAVIMGSSNAEKHYATSDGKYDNPSYVGWTYALNSQRTTSGSESNVKLQTEKWYNTNISAAAKAKVDSASKFCNDRNIGIPPSVFSWSTTYTTSWTTGTENSNRFAYKVAERIYGNSPTLSCSSGDVYTLSVGAITADEIMFAGGKTENNTSYYLYTTQNHWTMSPYSWSGGYATVFSVNNNGLLGGSWVSGTSGLRPVINLLPSVTFNLGSDGTASNPYIVQ